MMLLFGREDAPLFLGALSTPNERSTSDTSDTSDESDESVANDKRRGIDERRATNTSDKSDMLP
jgi:hypothetical protein